MLGSSGLRIEELLSESAYPHAVTRLALKQTHLSWVVLTGGFAYKLKKPVRFDFVDASALERRRHLCQEELRLNHRFAPELYLDVVPITREAGRLKVGGSGEPLEYAVRMREFAEAQELASRLERDAVTTQEIAALGGLLADTHAGADGQRVSDATARPPRGLDSPFVVGARARHRSAPTVGPRP